MKRVIYRIIDEEGIEWISGCPKGQLPAGAMILQEKDSKSGYAEGPDNYLVDQWSPNGAVLPDCQRYKGPGVGADLRNGYQQLQSQTRKAIRMDRKKVRPPGSFVLNDALDFNK